MSQSSRPPFLDLVPDFPKRLPYGKAFVRWWKETLHFIAHTWVPTENLLPTPAKRITPPVPDDLTFRGGAPSATTLAYVTAVREFVKAAELRLTTIRTKGSGLLGFVTLVTPLFVWWFVSGRGRLANAPIGISAAANVLGVCAAVFLALAIRAFLRTQAVVGYESETPDIFVDAAAATLKPYDVFQEIDVLLQKWGCVQRWADVLADHFRAGQRFLVIALTLTIVAGLPAYFYPVSEKADHSLVSIPIAMVNRIADVQSSLLTAAMVSLMIITISLQVVILVSFKRIYTSFPRHTARVRFDGSEAHTGGDIVK